MKTNTKGNNNQNINELFNYHFEKEVKEVKGSNATIGSKIKLKGLEFDATAEQKDLGIHFKSVKKRYSVSMEAHDSEDLVQEYAGLFLFVAQELEILEPIEELLANPDIYKQRIRFIKDGVAREMYNVAYPDKQRVKTADGYKHIDTNTVSYDVEIGEGDEATSMLSLIGEDQNIFSSKQDSTHNHFIQWFLQNKNSILTKKQLETYETLSEIYIPKTGNTTEDNETRKQMLEEAGLNNRNMKLLFKRIKERVIEAYKEEHKGKWHPVNFKSQKAIEAMFNEYVESADFTGWKTQEARQEELCGIIQEHYENSEEFELVVTEKLTLEEKKEVVRAVRGTELASNKVLRKINTNIKKAVAKRVPLEIEASYPEFEYNENPFSGISKLEGTDLLVTPAGSVVAKNVINIEEA
ncbi:hypothetical protein [Staphylococcus sp. LCT-H4]|uniref:hypothetical protein n=1 Tax=Staphylococcus sp. LCT-H4 TaxID=1914308 RepID=UPI000AA4581B|nr:hypothetical protein [Staphylococcus sp. LCT-H4]